MSPDNKRQSAGGLLIIGRESDVGRLTYKPECRRNRRCHSTTLPGQRLANYVYRLTITENTAIRQPEPLWSLRHTGHARSCRRNRSALLSIGINSGNIEPQIERSTSKRLPATIVGCSNAFDPDNTLDVIFCDVGSVCSP